VVGPARADGLHEVTTVLQRLDLADRIAVELAQGLSVRGFEADTLVRRALEALAAEAGVEPGWTARIWKAIPVASGLGGGSSDAATALRLANETLEQPLAPEALQRIARTLGADAPFFLEQGPQLGEDEGARLSPLDLPQDYWVVLVLPRGERKTSSATVYEAFDAGDGADGYDTRRAALFEALGRVRRAADLAKLPPNDLVSSPLAEELNSLGAFRADVSGAGPTAYGLFLHRDRAEAAREALAPRGQTWLTAPAWYV
jgi:4-diphosphocytidyl-2-C-methyl-D-erythritol kinase